MTRRKVFTKTDITAPRIEHLRTLLGQAYVLPEALPPAITAVGFPPNATGIRSFDFSPWYGIEIDAIAYAIQRQIERFVARQDSNIEASTATAYAAGSGTFLDYLARRAAALRKPIDLSDIDRDTLDGFLGFLRDAGTATTDQRVTYGQVKSVLKALCGRALINEVTEGDNRTFPTNPFPGAHRKSKGESPLSKAERSAFSRAVKTAVMPIFSPNVEVTGSLLACALLVIALHTGRNTTPLLEMTSDCLRRHPRDDKLFLVLWKRRGHSTHKVVVRAESEGNRSIESLPTLGGNVAELTRRVIELSNRLRPDAPEHLRDRVWLYRAISGSTAGYGGTVTSLTENGIRAGVRKLIADCNLVDSDGKPMRINISRLRKTFVNRIYEILGGDIVGTAQAAGNSPRVTETHYLRPGEDAEKNWRFLGIALVDELLSNTLGATERTPVGGCSDSKNGDYAPKRDGATCMSFLNCIRCRNYVVTGDDLYKLFSFHWRVLRERSRMDLRRWKRQFSHIARLIERDVVEAGLKKGVFKSAQVDNARERARHDPHPFWRSDTVLSDIGAMQV